jgi:RNA polymerase sigma factor (sigma-70 family)
LNIEQLLQGCKSGERKAQKAFFMHFSRYVYGVILRYVGSDFETKDVMQEVFLIVFKSLDSFEYHSEAKLRSWLKTISVREAIRQLKKNGWQEESIDEKDWDVNLAKAESILSELHQEELLKLLHRLPKGYRLVFNLYALEGYSHAEIASELGITESTSRSQLVRARKLLQQLTLKWWNDEK